MPTHGMRPTGYAVAVAALLALPVSVMAGTPEESRSHVEAVLTNIVTLHRPGQDGFATVWDGNKYVQCRRMPDLSLRCEFAGALMQPSLGRVLVPERIARLAALGWHLDPSFGNYVQSFPAGATTREIADSILLALKDGYDANLAELDVQSDWIKSRPCPPRNGPSQNLAGMINDHPDMAATAVRGCRYAPPPDLEPISPIQSKADIIKAYQTRVAGEVQRLRVNIGRWVYFVMDTGAGYIQCGSQPSPAGINCEAQSAESWPVLSRILTPDRVARLHAAGYADPGRSPNYSKTYAVGELSDTAIADELLTILHEIYGYDGAPKLKFNSEKGPG